MLSVGALKRGKNIPLALKIFKTFLNESKMPIEFVIVGGNYWEDPEISETIKKFDLQSHVKLTGFIPDRELRTIIAAPRRSL